MRRVTLKRPFTGGMVTDVPAHDLGPTYSPFIQDGFVPNGVLRQRAGWAYDGTTADVADNLVAVYRSQFILADTTRTVTGDDDGDLFIHNASASGTALYAGSVQFLPRCVYRDELILCAQDGLTPLRRYAGVAASSYTSAASTFTSGKATISATASNYGSPEVGMFIYGRTSGTPAFATCFKVIEVNSTTSLTIEDILADATAAVGNPIASATGTTAPVVSVYNAGTATTAGGGPATLTGTGTKWVNGGWGAVVTDSSTLDSDAMLLTETGATYGVVVVTTVTNDTSLAVQKFGAFTDQSYSLLRRCPFKDAASHKGSLWGTGVAQHPNRVYVAPPAWNPSLPPGFTIPVDVTGASDMESSNPNDFLLDFVDVPTATDGDNVIAILSSPNPLLVLKRKAVYGVFGSFPNFSVDMIADGIGCIDIRSAWSYDEGQFWAGETGIFWYRNGQITDLTAGRINREWRELTRDFDYGSSDYCTLGLSQGYLIVHITTGAGTTQRTYQCNLADGGWSRISNFTPRFMFTSRIPGEQEKLLAVSNDRQGRVIDFAPALNGEGTAEDDAGSGPRMQAYTPEGMDGSSIDDDTRLIDLAVHANVYDSGAAGTTSMAVSVVTQDALTSSGTTTTTLTDIDSDTTDRLDRHYYRSVNKRGRRHQVRFDVDTTGTDAASTKVEIHQIDATFRETRGRT